MLGSLLAKFLRLSFDLHNCKFSFDGDLSPCSKHKLRFEINCVNFAKSKLRDNLVAHMHERSDALKFQRPVYTYLYSSRAMKKYVVDDARSVIHSASCALEELQRKKQG